MYYVLFAKDTGSKLPDDFICSYMKAEDAGVIPKGWSPISDSALPVLQRKSAAVLEAHQKLEASVHSGPNTPRAIYRPQPEPKQTKWGRFTSAYLK